MHRWHDGRKPIKKLPIWLVAILSLVYVTLWSFKIYTAAEKSLRGESSGDWPVIILILAGIGVGMYQRQGRRRRVV